MSAIWSVINDALAMLKEPGLEMRMINVGLMGLRVDWDDTVRASVRPSRDPVISDRFVWERGWCTKKGCGGKEEEFSVCERRRPADRVMKGSCLSQNRREWIERKGVGRERSFSPALSWEMHLFNRNPSCQRMLIKKLRDVSLLQLSALQQPNFLQLANALLNHSQVSWSKFSLYSPKSQICPRGFYYQNNIQHPLPLTWTSPEWTLKWAETTGRAIKRKLPTGWTERLEYRVRKQNH